MISDCARRLVEALHEPASNEHRWEIAQRFLDDEHTEALGPPVPWSPNGTPETWEARKVVNGWPEAVSDGLTLPCADCGEVPRFDYRVTDEFWAKHVPRPDGLGVVCLPCLDRRCGGVGLAEAFTEVQWTGSGHTVVCKPAFRHSYSPNGTPESPVLSCSDATGDDGEA